MQTYYSPTEESRFLRSVAQIAGEIKQIVPPKIVLEYTPLREYDYEGTIVQRFHTKNIIEFPAPVLAMAEILWKAQEQGWKRSIERENESFHHETEALQQQLSTDHAHRAELMTELKLATAPLWSTRRLPLQKRMESASKFVPAYLLTRDKEMARIFYGNSATRIPGNTMTSLYHCMIVHRGAKIMSTSSDSLYCTDEDIDIHEHKRISKFLI